MNKDFLDYISTLTKEQLIALWESTQHNRNTISNFQEWLNYLDNINDKSGFNYVVSNNLLRVINSMMEEYGSFEEVDNHFEEVKSRTKEMCMYLPDFKTYFGVKNKKQMLEYDLSLYKFE